VDTKNSLARFRLGAGDAGYVVEKCSQTGRGRLETCCGKYTVLACSPVSMLRRPSERSCTSEMCHQRAERREQSRCDETLLLQVSQLLQPAASQTAESILLLSGSAVVRNRVIAAAPVCQHWVRPRSERLNGRGAISFVRGNTERKSVTADGISILLRASI
jgi:hypothetical protein